MIYESKLKSVKKLKYSDSFLKIRRPKVLHTFYLFGADLKKFCFPCFKKPTDKKSQALVSKRQGSQFIYHQLLVVIGMVDLSALNFVKIWLCLRKSFQTILNPGGLLK